MSAPARYLIAAVAMMMLAVPALSGCGQRFGNLSLSLSTGSPVAVYHQLGMVLSRAWAADMGIAPPAVQTSAGSGQNLDRLLAGEADIAFSAADAAATRREAPGGEHLRALARMHDDYLQVVVPLDSRVTRLADLRGLRVSVGQPHSGVEFVAERLLAKAGLSGVTDIQRTDLKLEQAAEALTQGSIDAFFWSGGIETEQISKLSERSPIRLVDLSDVLPAMRGEFPEYDAATIPASAYELGTRVTTLRVPNFLLVTDRMPTDVAEALTAGVFHARPALAAANNAARTIDVWSGIETIPIPLHEGALNYYRSISG